MRILRPLAVAALATLASCASDVTSPTADLNAAVDQVSGGGTASYESSAMTVLVPGMRATFPAVRSGLSGCAYSATNQRFDCSPLTMNGLTITRSVALLDASGQSLSTPDPAAVASIHAITDVKGTMADTGSISSITIDRHEDATMSGLHTATRLLNGTSTQALTMNGPDFGLTSSETSTTANLQLPKPSRTAGWPLGGTITTDRTFAFTGLGGLSSTSHEVLAFDGTSVMTLTVTTAGTTMTCKVDMAKPAAPPHCS